VAKNCFLVGKIRKYLDVVQFFVEQVSCKLYMSTYKYVLPFEVLTSFVKVKIWPHLISMNDENLHDLQNKAKSDLLT